MRREFRMGKWHGKSYRKEAEESPIPTCTFELDEGHGLVLVIGILCAFFRWISQICRWGTIDVSLEDLQVGFH